MTDTFSTVSGPFIEIENPHPAVEQLLGPLFSKVLVFAGPGAHISSLRNYQRFRDKMARLPADTLRTIGLPAVPPPTDIDMMALRQFLTEPFYGPLGMQDGWKLSPLGLKTLIASPLTSHQALENMIHPRAPGFVLEAISLRSSTPSDLLDSLVDVVLRGNHNPVVVFNLASHPNASVNALATARGLLANATPSSSLTRGAISVFEQAIARNKNTGKRDLSMLSRHDQPSVRKAVGVNLNTDVADLVTLSSDTNVHLRRAVAANPNLPKETLVAMSMDDSAIVRCGVARNLSIDEGTKTCLLQCHRRAIDKKLLMKLASNPNVSVEECFDLENPIHREILAEYSKAPHTLRALAGREDDQLLLFVAENISAPADVLGSLAGSTNAGVRENVACNDTTPSNILEQLSSDSNAKVRQRVVCNEHTPVTVLETLSSDDFCKEGAAYNVNTPHHILDILSRDEDEDVRWSVAMNISTPAHILEAMVEANEDNMWIMACLLRNRNLSLDCLSNAIVRELDRADEGERRLLQSFLAWRDTVSRQCELPVSTLVALSQSSNVSVRRMMAKDPLLPTSCLAMMSRDSNDAVVNNLASNPTVQIAADKLSCHLARGGLGRNKRPIAEISGS